MIFAAGMGTRLRPLTDTLPKALVPVKGVPMLEIMIRCLITHGVDGIVVNVHYYAEMIIEFLHKHDNFGIDIKISNEKDMLLETGGGLWNARRWLHGEESFFVCNADIFTNIDFTKLYQAHHDSGAMATLAVRNRNSSRELLWDGDMQLCGWRNNKEGKSIVPVPKVDLKPYAFSGIQVISPKIFDTCKRKGKFGLIDWYLDICPQNKILGYKHDSDIWIDIGSTKALEDANASSIIVW